MGDGAGDPYKQPLAGLLGVRQSAGMICGDSNPYEAVNEIVLEKRKHAVRYRNGQTLPTSAKLLFADARRKSRHSTTLSRNMVASGQARPGEVAAHHIVAVRDRNADRSRQLIFGWHIGINDVDNGVFLPRWRRSRVPGLPNAVKHSVVHTDRYHLEVFFRLHSVAIAAPQDHAGGRAELRSIKDDLVAGVFPYLPESGA